MLDTFIRPLKDRIVGPLGASVGAHVAPNGITVCAWVVGVAAAVAASRGAFAWALAMWVGNRVLDGLDGTVARAVGAQSDFGGYLDIVLDFSIYAMVPVALVFRLHAWAVAAAGVVLLGTFYVNCASWMYLAAILERRDRGATVTGERTTVTMPPGLIEGAETFAFYVLFLLFPNHLTLLFMAMSAGLVITIMQRLHRARSLLRS